MIQHLILIIQHLIPVLFPTEGEADWKMIAIAITDPWAAVLHDVTDLETKLPGRVPFHFYF